MKTNEDIHRKITVVSDGRVGNEAQALALAEALARARPATIHVLRAESPHWIGAMPASAIHAFGLGLFGVRFSDPLQPSDLIIGAGRRVAPAVAALARRQGIAAIQIMAPQMTTAAFTFIVIPKHDGLTGPNVFNTMGALSRITPERIRQAGRVWCHLADFKGSRLAVLVGGPGRSARFSSQDGIALISLLGRLEKSHRLLITPSRRTPDDLLSQLWNRFAAQNFVWNGSGCNPYPGLLEWCNAVLVTEDSVNMVSEAASTGLPVHIAPITGLAAKLKRFHSELSVLGVSRRVELPLATWTYQPLREADRIATDIASRLGW